jgi:(2Fe-2S) ferredoxin
MGKDLTKVTNTVFICNGSTCKKNGAEESVRELRCAIKMAGLHEITHTVKTLCLGQCENAPVLFVDPQGSWYKRMTTETMDEFVNIKLKQKGDLDYNLLFSKGWTKMFPARDIEPKTRHEFSVHQDESIGEIYGAAIYPWEHNVYPLLKEIFQVYRSQLAIYHYDQLLRSEEFSIQYMDGKATVTGNSAAEKVEVIMAAARESEFFLLKVSRVKMYQRSSGSTRGLYIANSRNGIFLNVEWNGEGNFWSHVVDNYINISG